MPTYAMNILNYTLEHECGNLIKNKKNAKNLLDAYHFTCRLPTILKENEFDLSETKINKIFCAQWLDDRSVILGTKCNKLVILDTISRKHCLMNPLKSHENSVNIAQNCGMHSISINPSRTMIATGSDNVNDIAIYRLPDLMPLCVGWDAHKNWIFDTTWIDDNHVVSGAGDSKLALWTIDSNDVNNDVIKKKRFYDNIIKEYSESVNHYNRDDDVELHQQHEEEEEEDDDDDVDTYDACRNTLNKRRRLNIDGKFKVTNSYKFKKATKVLTCKQGKRIRALAFNKKNNEIAAIAMNATFHIFNAHRFEQNFAKKLSLHKENVCLAINSENTCYAIGSASHVQLLIADSGRSLLPPIFVKKDIGIRSLNFRNNILSIGTGNGTVLFYDLRKLNFLKNELDKDVKLQIKNGWILRNDNYYEYLSFANSIDRTHAIYSHCYDPSGTKMLTVGGPLTVGLYGHYASVWR